MRPRRPAFPPPVLAFSPFLLAAALLAGCPNPFDPYAAHDISALPGARRLVPHHVADGAAFAPDARRWIAWQRLGGGRDALFDGAEGRDEPTWRVEPEGELRDVAWAPDGGSAFALVVGGTPERGTVWRLAPGRPEAVGLPLPGGVEAVAPAPGGARLAFLATEGTETRALVRGSEPDAVAVDVGPADALAWAPDGRLALLAWGEAGKAGVLRLRAPDGRMADVATDVAAGARGLAWGGADRLVVLPAPIAEGQPGWPPVGLAVRIFDLAAGTGVTRVLPIGEAAPPVVTPGPRVGPQRLGDFVLDPAGTRLAFGRDGGEETTPAAFVVGLSAGEARRAAPLARPLGFAADRLVVEGGLGGALRNGWWTVPVP